ncbi:unnamed protein product [Knipowitschia caucasica]|uniref:Uncharacterized protein n=1 Tax=Knipowitschia caucasica TaxID=637954 RepID=A0AAV2KHQ2_KNICA
MGTPEQRYTQEQRYAQLEKYRQNSEYSDRYSPQELKYTRDELKYSRDYQREEMKSRASSSSSSSSSSQPQYYSHHQSTPQLFHESERADRSDRSQDWAHATPHVSQHGGGYGRTHALRNSPTPLRRTASGGQSGEPGLSRSTSVTSHMSNGSHLSYS